MKLSVKGLALSFGVLWGLCIFIMTLVALYFNGYGQVFLDSTAGAFYPYYDTSLQGAFIGLVAGFVDGVIGGALVAWLYNKFSKCCKK